MKSLYFDDADRSLLSMVNAALDNGRWDEANSFDPDLHPHGIIELTTTHEYRMAHAAVRLLSSIEAGQTDARLAALATLHDEVMHSARTQFRYNTGRALLQLMKEIVRTRHDTDAQLRLMHDFRKIASGNPLAVRRILARHYLLEMPEDMSQLALDYHVHDANTKGRKNPTHLIMDAWIKGIRYLSVIYYNFIDAGAARELLTAADIMGITVRIGIEYRCIFRHRFVDIVWTPRGLTDATSFLTFLEEKPVKVLLAEGKKASAWVAQRIYKALEYWNSICRPKQSAALGIELAPVTEQEFAAYVGSGQASVLHLAECLHKRYLPDLAGRAAELRSEYGTADEERRKGIDALLRRLDAVTPEAILHEWLTPEAIPELKALEKPDPETGMPKIMTLPPEVIIDWLGSIRTGYRITLQLRDLTPEDVLELLWDGQGMITHLELFNLKEWQEGHLDNLASINELQRAINADNALHLKRMMLGMIANVKHSRDEERLEKLHTILRNIPALQAPYQTRPLKSHIGTDSTSNANVRHGMGFAVVETLPKRTRAFIRRSHGDYRMLSIPIRTELSETHVITQPPKGLPVVDACIRLIRRIPGFRRFGMLRKVEWTSLSTRVSEGRSNVVTMGGSTEGIGSNNLYVLPDTEKKTSSPGLAYLNTTLLCWIKIIAGFIPAQAAFLYTDTWWFLACFGALLWYFITLGRNIVQAVLSGGGLVRSMLTWKEYVNWRRIADSLFYTGVSVWLLEVMIRRWLLEDAMGCTVQNHALVVYSVLAACNGIYISTHNVFRGFPRQAIIANLFRSAFAIPLSWLLGEGMLSLCNVLGVADPMLLTQNCAAVISKCASDIVAAMIEGIADSNQNRRLRLWDYSTKLKQVFDNFTAIETRLPDVDLLALMGTPSDYLKTVGSVDPVRLRRCTMNALDMLYFWMYQPYAPQTLRRIASTMNPEERLFLMRSQNVLLNTKFVSTLLVNGIVGPRFAPALAFYLNGHENYLKAIGNLYDAVSKTKGTDAAEDLSAEDLLLTNEERT